MASVPATELAACLTSGYGDSIVDTGACSETQHRREVHDVAQGTSKRTVDLPSAEESRIALDLSGVVETGMSIES